MRVLFIRHAWAEDREKFAASGKADALRPLTGKGVRRMHQVARDLHRQVADIGVLASSSLVRARQTAEIVASAYHDLPIVEIDELHPGCPPAALSGWLSRHMGAGPVALVGHEPDLSDAIAWFLTGVENGSFIKMKKGQICCLEIPPGGGPGTSVLRWSTAPEPLHIQGAI